MNDHERVDRFTELSRLLLDIDDLHPTSARVYLAMLDDLDDHWPLDEMATGLSGFAGLAPDERERLIVDALTKHPRWHDATVALLQVWYSGSLTRPNGDLVTQPPEAYLGALVWPLLGTQAPGLPGPFFGEWSHPPTRVASPVRPPPRRTGAAT